MCRAAHPWRIQCVGNVPGLFCMHNINTLHSHCCTTTALTERRREGHHGTMQLLPIAPNCSLGLLHVILVESSIFQVIKNGGPNNTDLGSQAHSKHPFLKGGWATPTMLKPETWRWKWIEHAWQTLQLFYRLIYLVHLTLQPLWTSFGLHYNNSF